MPSSSSSSSPSCIPILDYRDFQSNPQILLQAAEEWGTFRLINHPIPLTLMAKIKATATSLLNLPVEIKQKNKDIVIAESGYVPTTTVNPLYEALGVYNAGCPEAVEEFCSQLDASPLQRETINTYSEVICELVRDIGRKLCQGMGLNLDLFKEWTCLLKMNKYHFSPETIGSYGVQIHTDSGFLTIVYDDECVGGLEVMHDKVGEFVVVDPLPGSLLINFGDVAKVWSNGRIKTAIHRVLCKEATPRVSLPLFVLGPSEGAVEAPQELVDKQHPRLFHPLKIEEYRKLRASTGLRTGETLASILREPNKQMY